MSEQQSLEHTVRLLGRKEELERIIKLLEEQRNLTSQNYKKDIESDYWATRLDFIAELIALIKG